LWPADGVGEEALRASHGQHAEGGSTGRDRGGALEVALCLDTKARLSELAGRADDHARERADAILDELGATTPPRVPLPEPTSVVEHVPSTSR
jgi:hypothetical protein